MTSSSGTSNGPATCRHPSCSEQFRVAINPVTGEPFRFCSTDCFRDWVKITRAAWEVAELCTRCGESRTPGFRNCDSCRVFYRCRSRARCVGKDLPNRGKIPT